MRLKVYLPGSHQGELYDLFCYSSHGLPGLEIVGLGVRARALKEKIVYLTKGLKLKIPLKRYVVCLDQTVHKNERDEFFELPILILYWAMAGILPVVHLRDCLCAGKISSKGQVTLPRLDQLHEYIQNESLIVIGASEQLSVGDDVRFIELAELIAGFSISIQDPQQTSGLDRKRLNHINIAR